MEEYRHVGGEDCDLFSLNLPKATPTLTGKDAVRFEEKVREGLKNPTGLIPTPKLQDVTDKILKHILEG